MTAGNPVNNSFKGEEAGCIVKEIASQTEFEQWVNEIPKRLSLLQTIVPTEIYGALDFSLHSLNVLGSWIVYTYPDYEAYRQTDHKDWTAVFGTYVGETFIKLLGGHWDINLHDDDLAYWRIPGIVGHQSPEGPYHVYPSTWITTTILRQDEEFIQNVVEAWVTGLPIKKRISK